MTTLNVKIKQLESRIDDLEDEIENKMMTIDKLTKEILVLEKMRCPRCDGSGIEYFITQGIDFIVDKCPECKGTGYED